jgi:hypothetical protein
MADRNVRIDRLVLRVRGEPPAWTTGLAERLPSALLHELRAAPQSGEAPVRLRLQPEASAGSAERQIARRLAAAIGAAARGQGGGGR